MCECVRHHLGQEGVCVCVEARKHNAGALTDISASLLLGDVKVIILMAAGISQVLKGW